MQRTVAAATLVGLLCLSVVGGVAIKEVIALDRNLSQVLEHVRRSKEDRVMQEIVEEVKRSNGRVVTVRTVRKPGESEDEFVERHDNVVGALL